MHRSISPLLFFSFLLRIVSLVSAQSTNNTSFNDVVDLNPSCARSCVRDSYSTVLSDCGGAGEIGNSEKTADLICICRGGKQTPSELYSQGEDMSQCVLNVCDQSGFLDYYNVLLNFIDFCQNLVVSEGISPSSSGGGVGVSSSSFRRSATLATPSRTSGGFFGGTTASSTSTEGAGSGGGNSDITTDPGISPTAAGGTAAQTPSVLSGNSDNSGSAPHVPGLFVFLSVEVLLSFVFGGILVWT